MLGVPVHGKFVPPLPNTWEREVPYRVKLIKDGRIAEERPVLINKQRILYL